MLHIAKESFVGEIDGVTYSFTAGKSIVDGSKPQQGKLLKLWGHLFEPLVSSFDHLEKPKKEAKPKAKKVKAPAKAKPVALNVKAEPVVAKESEKEPEPPKAEKP